MTCAQGLLRLLWGGGGPKLECYGTVLSCKVDQIKGRDAQCLGTCTPSGSRKLPQQRNSGGESSAKSLEEVTESE